MSVSNAVARCCAAARFFAVAVIVLLGACSRELPPRSTLEFMSDPAVRDAVLLRCNQLQGAALRDAECRNVREAVDRLAAEEERQPDQAKEEHDSFQKAREARRARDESERLRREASEKPVDPYTMPLVPEQPAASIPTAAVMSAASLPES